MKIVLLTPLLGLYAFANIGTIMALKGKATIQRGFLSMPKWERASSKAIAYKPKLKV